MFDEEVLVSVKADVDVQGAGSATDNLALQISKQNEILENLSKSLNFSARPTQSIINNRPQVAQYEGGSTSRPTQDPYQPVSGITGTNMFGETEYRTSPTSRPAPEQVSAVSSRQSAHSTSEQSVVQSLINSALDNVDKPKAAVDAVMDGLGDVKFDAKKMFAGLAGANTEAISTLGKRGIAATTLFDNYQGVEGNSRIALDTAIDWLADSKVGKFTHLSGPVSAFRNWSDLSQKKDLAGVVDFAKGSALNAGIGAVWENGSSLAGMAKAGKFADAGSLIKGAAMKNLKNMGMQAGIFSGISAGVGIAGMSMDGRRKAQDYVKEMANYGDPSWQGTLFRDWNTGQNAWDNIMGFAGINTSYLSEKEKSQAIRMAERDGLRGSEIGEYVQTQNKFRKETNKVFSLDEQDELYQSLVQTKKMTMEELTSITQTFANTAKNVGGSVTDMTSQFKNIIETNTRGVVGDISGQTGAFASTLVNTLQDENDPLVQLLGGKEKAASTLNAGLNSQQSRQFAYMQARQMGYNGYNSVESVNAFLEKNGASSQIASLRGAMSRINKTSNLATKQRLSEMYFGNSEAYTGMTDKKLNEMEKEYRQNPAWLKKEDQEKYSRAEHLKDNDFFSNFSEGAANAQNSIGGMATSAVGSVIGTAIGAGIGGPLGAWIGGSLGGSIGGLAAGAVGGIGQTIEAGGSEQTLKDLKTKAQGISQSNNAGFNDATQEKVQVDSNIKIELSPEARKLLSASSGPSSGYYSGKSNLGANTGSY